MGHLHEFTKMALVDQVYGSAGIQDLSRLQYPIEGDPSELQDMITRRKESSSGDEFTILVDGAFDVPHPAHEAYLRHVRAMAGVALLAQRGQEATISRIRDVVASNDLTVITTVDADSKVAQKKGGKPEKGGVARPIYPWITRAERVLGYNFDTNGRNRLRPTVDIATVEGDEIHKDTPFESSIRLAECLHKGGLLDGIVVFGEHQATAEEARSKGLSPIIIPESNYYSLNPHSSKPWSSSSIIARAQGGAVENPITRPTHLPSWNGVHRE